MASVKMEDMFVGDTDRFKGVTVWSNKEECSQEELGPRLLRSLQVWREGGVRAVWFHVDTGQVDWVPVLAKQVTDRATICNVENGDFHL